MKLYLSSYGLGNEIEKLKTMIPKGKIGYIPNALDFSNADVERRERHIERDMNSLRELGLEVELLDLKNFFGKKDKLKKKVEDIGAVFVSGGNTFILRQAMKISGLDEILIEMKENNVDFLYAGYSAGGCVLAPSFRNYSIVDNSNDFPYEEIQETIWDGLGLVDFALMPHFESEHPESQDVGKEIELCKKHNIPYKAIRDGEVIIIE